MTSWSHGLIKSGERAVHRALVSEKHGDGGGHTALRFRTHPFEAGPT